MARVVIIEDEAWDVINRYRPLLAQRHEILLFLLHQKKDSLDASLRVLTREGFPYPLLKFDVQHIPPADLYLSDGLRGTCFTLLPHLPRERTYVHSGDIRLLQMVEQCGYATIWNPDDIPRIASKHAPSGH